MSRLARQLGRLKVRTLESLNRRFSLVGAGPVWGVETFGWLADLQAHAGVIRDELTAYTRAGRHIPEINETDSQAHAMYGNARWDMLHLMLVGQAVPQVLVHFPRTAAVLARVPGTCHAKFSVLSAERHEVPRHRDAYNGVLRLHLGLEVPTQGDCFIRIGPHRMDWQDGKAFVFDPGVEHEVRKSAAERRVILIADFFRPLPRWLQEASRGYYRKLGLRPEVTAVRKRYSELFGQPAVHAVPSRTADFTA